MSKYQVGLQLYAAVRDEFVAGKPVREIGLEHNMEPLHILGFLKWVGREFEIERLVRSDQLKGKLLRVANNLAAKAAELSEDPEPEKLRELMEVLEYIHKIFGAVSKEEAEFIRERAARRHLWKTDDPATNGAAAGGLDDAVTGGRLESGTPFKPKNGRSR